MTTEILVHQEDGHTYELSPQGVKEVVIPAFGGDDYFDRLCRANFVIGYLKQSLVSLGMTNDEVEAQIAKAEAEHKRIFG